MNLITKIEKQKTYIVGGILFIAFCALMITSLRSPAALDPFWHLQMGKDWLENGLSPWIDHYSFTYYGHAITNPPVFFQALLFLATSHFDLVTGFQIIRFGFFLLTLGASVLLLRQMKAPAVIYALVIPMIVFLLQMRAMVRPELFSYTLSIVALLLYFRARNCITARNLIPMVALMWFWSIYHSSVIGYIIFFGFFLDCAVAQINSRAPVSVWVKWFMWGLLLVAVGFLNPSFSHPLVQAITFPSEWKILIAEYLPSGRGLQSIVGIYALILFAVLVPVLALKQRRIGILVVWVVLVYSAVMMRRMMTPSGIVVVFLAAQLLVDSRVFHRLSLKDNKVQNKLAWFVLLVTIGVTLYSNIDRAKYFMRENQAFLGRYPTPLADYMIEHKVSGRIFNIYSMGGYLIYRLAHQNQVYIDGRTQILYPLEHMKRYEEVFKTRDPAVLKAELDEYSVDQIIWRYSQKGHDLVQDMGGFGLDFLDARLVLYTRGTSNFPVLGKLLTQPECWRPNMLDRLVSERQRMDEILPGYSALFPFADLIVGYSKAEDGKAFFDENIDGDKWFDEMRRFAGYRFLETGEYDLVVNLLGGVEIRKPKDYLASALAMIKTANFEIASRIVEDFSSIEWLNLKPEEVFIHFKLYQSLATQRELTAAEQKNAEALKLKIEDLGYSGFDMEQELGAQSFCVSTESNIEMSVLTGRDAASR